MKELCLDTGSRPFLPQTQPPIIADVIWYSLKCFCLLNRFASQWRISFLFLIYFLFFFFFDWCADTGMTYIGTWRAQVLFFQAWLFTHNLSLLIQQWFYNDESPHLLDWGQSTYLILSKKKIYCKVHSSVRRSLRFVMGIKENQSNFSNMSINKIEAFLTSFLEDLAMI